MHIRSKCSGAMCLLAATCRGHARTRVRGHAAKYLHSKTPMTTSTQVFTGQEGSLGAGFFFVVFLSYNKRGAHDLPDFCFILFPVFQKTQPASELLRVASGRTVCGFAPAPSPGEAGLVMQMCPFNGPIAAWATCKATRRQRASASDWPAERPQRSQSRSTHYLRAAEKSPG